MYFNGGAGNTKTPETAFFSKMKKIRHFSFELIVSFEIRELICENLQIYSLFWQDLVVAPNWMRNSRHLVIGPSIPLIISSSSSADAR